MDRIQALARRAVSGDLSAALELAFLLTPQLREVVHATFAQQLREIHAPHLREVHATRRTSRKSPDEVEVHRAGDVVRVVARGTSIAVRNGSVYVDGVEVDGVCVSEVLHSSAKNGVVYLEGRPC